MTHGLSGKYLSSFVDIETNEISRKSVVDISKTSDRQWQKGRYTQTTAELTPSGQQRVSRKEIREHLQHGGFRHMSKGSTRVRCRTPHASLAHMNLAVMASKSYASNGITT